MKYIVEIEPGVFLATWAGDPGRTLIESSAKRYANISSATYALAYARRFRDCANAFILQVDDSARPVETKGEEH